MISPQLQMECSISEQPMQRRLESCQNWRCIRADVWSEGSPHVTGEASTVGCALLCSSLRSTEFCPSWASAANLSSSHSGNGDDWW